MQVLKTSEPVILRQLFSSPDGKYVAYGFENKTHKGNVDINLVDGVENFDNMALFMSGACQTIIGVDWQKRQMKLFNHATLVTIPDAGHEMFYENPEASVMAVRTYLHTPNP